MQKKLYKPDPFKNKYVPDIKNPHRSQTKNCQLILIKPHLVAVIRRRLRLAATQQSRTKNYKLLLINNN